MPSRSFYDPPDFRHIEVIVRDLHPDVSDKQIERFRKKGIPPLVSAGSLAYALGVSTKLIFSLTSKPEKHYRTFPLAKQNGQFRTINAPRTYLKVVQWWILDNILKSCQFPKYVTGFVRGRGPYVNAECHRAAKHTLNVDISDFFTSVNAQHVLSIWQRFGYAPNVTALLTRLCCFEGHLPQGAPTSPTLANLAVRALDKDLFKLARQHRLKYSRYADDITFSGRQWIPNNLPGKIREMMREHGYNINTKKTRFKGPGDRKEVTGFVVGRGVQPPREWRNRVRAAFHQATRRPEEYRNKIDVLNGYLGLLATYGEPSSNKLHAQGLAAMRAIQNSEAQNV